MADAPIKFDRTPYTVKYYDLHGKVQSIRRRPPKKLHTMLPTDKVELTKRKNDDWPEGNTYTIESIKNRHPNTLQIRDEDGKKTFVSYSDVTSKEKVGIREDGSDPRDDAINNEYLTWP